MATNETFMQRALELAARGEGLVEPNPMVGCVVARDGQIVGEGWHERYGEAHAEVNALAEAGDAAQGATLYVSLEPCRHTGKTPPCTQAILSARIARVVVAARDPFPEVNGGGIAELKEAGVEVETGVEQAAAEQLLAPYLKLTRTARPWVVAKWAMTLDGKIATRTGSSQWISSAASRQIVHSLRGRVDAVLIGRRTAITDDPLLTARPDPGQDGPLRTATRIVLGAPPRDCQLLQTIDQAPLLVVARDASDAAELAWVSEAGGEVLAIEAATRGERFAKLLDELGQRRMTNVLVEGGAGVLGAALDARQVDEVHVFVGPKLVGGQPAPSPIEGEGIDQMADALRLAELNLEQVGGDAYLHGRLDD